MTIIVSKQAVGAESIILWTFHEEWQWRDFVDAIDQSNTIMQNESYSRCVVLNVRYNLPNERIAIPNLRHAITQFADCDVLFVMEGAEMDVNVTINVFKEEFAEVTEKVFIFNTIDEAYLFIDPCYSAPKRDELPQIILKPPSRDH